MIRSILSSEAMKHVEILANVIKDKTFARFIIVGMLNTLFGYSVFAFFIFLNVHYTLAALFATFLGVLFNFKTIGILVFKNRRNSLILKFVAVYAFTYSLNIIFLKMFSLYDINMYVAGLVLLLPLAITSFLLNRHFVFQEKRILP